MQTPSNLDLLEDVVAELKSIRCKARLDLIDKFKASFGEHFDELEFYNYETGAMVKGAALRDAQTGCEIYERLGWDRSAAFGHDIFKCGCKPSMSSCSSFQRQEPRFPTSTIASRSKAAGP